jgi:hypothetical protein
MLTDADVDRIAQAVLDRLAPVLVRMDWQADGWLVPVPSADDVNSALRENPLLRPRCPSEPRTVDPE